MMITGRGFPRPSLWFLGVWALWVVCGFRGLCWVPGCVGPCGFGCVLRRWLWVVVFCSSRGCNSISVFLWHCLCVVLVYVNAFN